MPKKMIPPALLEQVKEKLLRKIERRPDGCWIYLGATNDIGYPTWRPYTTSKTQYVHRCSYEIFHGPIPDGAEVDHICHVRNCVNPDHLQALSHRENLMRSPNQPAAKNARKTHCIRGHELTPENTYEQPRGRGCVECRRMRARGELGPVARLREQDRLRA